MAGFEKVPFEVVDANLSHSEIGAIENFRGASLGWLKAHMVGYGDYRYATVFSRGGDLDGAGYREQLHVISYVQSRLTAEKAEREARGQEALHMDAVTYLGEMGLTEVRQVLVMAEALARGEQ